MNWLLQLGGGSVDEDTVMRTLLFDFYGELLTPKQREYFDLHYNDDLSLFEIAEQNGTSRQAVWDIIRRAESALRDIEKRTGLVRRETARRAAAAKIRSELAELAPQSGCEAQLRRIIAELEASDG